jgi:hypothetical protein
MAANLRPTHEQPPGEPGVILCDELPIRLNKKYGSDVGVIYLLICGQAQHREPCTLEILEALGQAEDVPQVPKVVKKLRSLRLVRWVEDAPASGGAQ